MRTSERSSANASKPASPRLGVRADIRGNTVPLTANTFDYPTFDGAAPQFAYVELSGATAELVDNAPASATANAEMQSQNTGAVYADPGVALIPGPISIP